MSNRPGPKGHWLIGSAADFAKDPIQFLSDLRDKYHGIAYFKWGFSMRTVFVSNADWVQQILQKNYKNYPKPDNGLKILVGNGLLTSEGDFWLRQRRLASPVFHKKRIAEFGDAMVRHTRELLDGQWATYEQAGEKFDLTQELMALTLGIIGETMMSWSIREDHAAAKVYESLTWLLEDTMQRTLAVFSFPLWVPTARNNKFKRERKALGGLLDEVIADHLQRPGHYQDLLAMLIGAEDADTGEKMSAHQLKDEALTMILAGHETTALALTWAFCLLAQNPDKEAILLKELITVLQGRTPTIMDLPQLPYLSRVVDEVLRIYPPAWFTARKAAAADSFGDFDIDKDTEVIISPYIVHHSPEYWPDPEKFEPNRFLPEQVNERPKYAYFPFGGGPRVCMGNNFALMEMQLILATVLTCYQVRLQPDADLTMRPGVTLRPGGPVWVILQPRAA